MMTIPQPGCQSQVNLVASRYLDVLGSNLPIDERISLSKLSPSDVPAWADARMQDYRRRLKEIEGYIATFGSLRNTQSSIHVLPSELLARIFVYACTTWRDLPIARACRHWHAVITSTPRVWANAIKSRRLDCEQTADQNFLRVALANSGSLPLTIAIATYGSHEARSILSPHFFRLVSLTVHVYKDDQVATLAAALSSGSLLNLRTLRATRRGRLWAPPGPPQLLLDSQYLPHLRELYIEGALLTSTSTVGSTLENLTITGEVRESSQWRVICQALQRCVALKTLALLSQIPEEWPDQADTNDTDLPAVSLPQLHKLTLRHKAILMRKLLHCLHIPSSTTVSIIMVDLYGITFLDAVPHDYMQRFHTQPPIDRLHIHGPQVCQLQTSARCYAAGRERLHMATIIYGNDGLHGFLEPLLGACEHGALQTLAFDKMDTRRLTSWNLLFQQLPNLRRLELFGRTSTAVRTHLAALFLGRGNHRPPDAESSGLTLAWVVTEDEADEGDALLGLDALASVLEGASTRCGRLELYAAKPSKKEEEQKFQSLAAIPTDPDLFRTVAAPILPRLASLVDVLTIH